MSADLWVDASDGARLAVRDHGGAGPDLVLLHGAGTHLLSLERLTAELGGFRIVTADARWSGQSGDADTYDWAQLIRDVEAIVEQVDLDAPVVAGHSWGGMIAAHYGAAHPEARAVINVDGHGAGDPSLYDGLDQAEAEAAIEMVTSGNDLFGDAPVEGDAEWLEGVRGAVELMTRMMGVPEDHVAAYVDRSFVDLGAGRWARRPSPTLYAGLAGDLRLFDLYRRVEGPLQIISCPAPLTFVPPTMVDVLAAHRRGLARALDDLTADRPNVTTTTLEGVDHLSAVAGDAPAVAAAMCSFLAEVGVVGAPTG
jgi:pimeloyl-ACP methyl ester carboxylesterase